jgi:L-ascorbate metabolism protein UlaG (beta-lactamase superfamily)
MKITKLEHSCLLVEMPEPVNRTVLFDPGVMSEPYVDVDSLEYLDDIIITHKHSDHMHPPLISKLLQKFPEVRITAPSDATQELKQAGIMATNEEYEGVAFFDAPHEEVAPLFPRPEQNAVHYLDMLTHPGDSHSFSETKAILALPMTAPWGAMIKAVNLGLKLKPKYVIPVHDWHWRPEAKEATYGSVEKIFADAGITFLNVENGKPVVIDL